MRDDAGFPDAAGPPAGEQDLDAAQQKALLRERFAGAGWEAPRVLAALEETEDFYFDVLRQVRMPRWSNGRVVLTGDAAWCVTPLGGRGTTLAIVGAYVLAGELARAGLDKFGEAFAAYDRVMRPMVEEAQGVPEWLPRVFYPRSKLGVRVLRGALRAVSSPPLRGWLARLGGAEKLPTLPDYAG